MRPPTGMGRWLAEQQLAAAPLPLLGALSAPAVRVGLPTSNVGTKKRCMRRACGTGIRTVPISDSAITRKEDVIRRLLAHHAEQTKRAAKRVQPAPAPGYRPETLQVLFGTSTP